MIGVTWTGWDGSVWDLHNGPVYLGPGFEGFSMLTGEAFVRETALTDGQYYTGWRANPRAVLFPVIIGKAATDAAWYALDKAWWKTMRINKTGTLAVTALDGTVRRLKLRFVDDGDLSWKFDPSRQRLTTAGLKMVADSPWWTGDTFGTPFRNSSTPVNFFGGAAGLAAPFIIGMSNTIATATITNPGDIPAWPRYIIRGPALSFRSTLNGHVVGGTITVLAGETLVIDTAPNMQVAYLYSGTTKTNVTRRLSNFDFARLPDGDSVKLDIQLDGDGSITLEADPKYYKAW